MIRIAKISHEGFNVKEIKGNLESLQKEVGGSGVLTLCLYYSELSEKGIDIYVDANGVLYGSDIYLMQTDKSFTRIENAIAGNVVFTGHDEEGNVKGLTDEQIEFMRSRLNNFSEHYLFDFRL